MNKETAFIFPGQGSQFIGMGKELYEAFLSVRILFQEADEILGYDLSNLILNGSEAELTMTYNAQPAIFLVSIAALITTLTHARLSVKDACACVAGHSLGEYSALTAAESIRFVDSLKLLRIRGQSMQNAVHSMECGMAVVLGTDLDKVRNLLQEVSPHGICDIANDNTDDQVVISGHKIAIDMAIKLAAKYGAKRVLPISVSAPFHSRLMKPAAAIMEDALKSVTICNPVTGFIPNILAHLENESTLYKNLLVSQVTDTVRWRESIEYMYKVLGIRKFVEFGPGKTLSNMIKRSYPDSELFTILTPKDIEYYASYVSK